MTTNCTIYMMQGASSCVVDCPGRHAHGSKRACIIARAQCTLTLHYIIIKRNNYFMSLSLPHTVTKDLKISILFLSYKRRLKSTLFRPSKISPEKCVTYMLIYLFFWACSTQKPHPSASPRARTRCSTRRPHPPTSALHGMFCYRPLPNICHCNSAGITRLYILETLQLSPVFFF